MKTELRKFPRIKSHARISYEFVKWSESGLDKIKKPNYAITFDISVGGIGLSELHEVSPSMLKKLRKGTRKIRLAIFLYRNKPPLMTFARLIWNGTMDTENIQRFGFIFIDVSPHFYIEIMKYMNRHLKK